MSSEVGSGHVAVFPVMTGFRRAVNREMQASGTTGAKTFASGFARGGRKAGEDLGKGVKSGFGRTLDGLASDGLKRLQADVAKAAGALNRARLSQQDAAGRVRVAEAQLAEAISKSGEGSARAIAAAERLESARRREAAATDAVTGASERLKRAQESVAGASALAVSETSRLSRLLAPARGALEKFRAGWTDAEQAMLDGAGRIGKLGGTVRAGVDRIAAPFQRLGGMIARPFQSLGSLISRPLSSLGSKIAAPFQRLGSQVSTWLQPVTGAFSRVWDKIGPTVSRGASGLGSWFAAGAQSLVSSASRIASQTVNALSRGLAGPATAVVAAAAAGLGVSLTRGFSRLGAIEDAQAKLRGLGNDAATVDQIMQDATASVKGTAFGLDEAATTAAGAVAAGIRPGERLQDMLKGVANVAAATNSGMGEMGSIFNKVAATGRAYAENINQLADRGLPIWQALADQFGVTTDEVRTMASEGKIGFDEFAAAASAAAGTVADEMGKTTSGSWKNFMASIGRIGANLLSGIYPMIAPLIQAVTGALGPIEEKAKNLGTVLGEQVGPIVERLTGWLSNLGTEGGGGISTLMSNLGGMGSTLGPLLGAVGALGAGGCPGCCRRSRFSGSSPAGSPGWPGHSASWSGCLLAWWPPRPACNPPWAASSKACCHR